MEVKEIYYTHNDWLCVEKIEENEQQQIRQENHSV